MKVMRNYYQYLTDTAYEHGLKNDQRQQWWNCVENKEYSYNIGGNVN